MKATVEAFNALVLPTVLQKGAFDETHGWIFMVLLKISRAMQGVYHEDDYDDLIGYAALTAESAHKEYSGIEYRP